MQILRHFHFPHLHLHSPPPFRHHRKPFSPFALSFSSTNPQKLSSLMEVEVKLRLKDSTAHQTLTSLLAPHLTQTHFQHNHFFDTPTSTLSSHRAVLRLRFYGHDPSTALRCVASLKSKPTLVDGVSTVAEDEEDLDPSVARAILSDPNLIGSTNGCRVLKRVREEFGVEEGSEWVCLGGFRNVRGVCEWKGLRLEVDQSMFQFGTLFEVECESEEPEKAKEVIEGFLKENGIPYTYSKMSKFAIFRAGKLPEIADD